MGGAGEKWFQMVELSVATGILSGLGLGGSFQDIYFPELVHVLKTALGGLPTMSALIVTHTI